MPPTIRPSDYTNDPREQEAIAKGWRPTHALLLSRGKDHERFLLRVAGEEGPAQTAQEFLQDPDARPKKWMLVRGVWHDSGIPMPPPRAACSTSVLEWPDEVKSTPPNLDDVLSSLSDEQRRELGRRLSPEPGRPTGPGVIVG